MKTISRSAERYCDPFESGLWIHYVIYFFIPFAIESGGELINNLKAGRWLKTNVRETLFTD